MSTNSAPISDPTPAVHLRAIDYAPWQAVQMHLQAALESRGLLHLLSPVTLIVRDLIEGATHALHLHVFSAILADESGVEFSQETGQIEILFNAEMEEHGVHNIVRACQVAGKEVIVDFPAFHGDAPLVCLRVPYRWQAASCRTDNLIEALGLVLGIETDSETSSLIALRRCAHRVTAATSLTVADAAVVRNQLARIGTELGYGMIRFSPAGEVLELSPSMLTQLGLDAGTVSKEALSALIPLNFLNDIIWGMALADGNGAFENYRIRVRQPGSGEVSVLFNVSGFRDSDGSVPSLWQKVASETGAAQRGEGSILSEVRVLNITRNYVPKLVEQKARDAVRLGRTALSNEERTLAVLFCDIVGYTSYVEDFGASESIINTLNSILHRVAGSVGRNSGSIDKFMGDSIMALFDDPADAVAAAIDMQSHSVDINQMRSRGGQQMLQLRIGIHWGDVVLGNVGTTERLDWTAIGDVVNTASRIEKNCRPGSILVSAVVHAAVDAARPGSARFGPAFGLKVKGKAEQLAVCEVLFAPEVEAA